MPLDFKVSYSLILAPGNLLSLLHSILYILSLYLIYVLSPLHIYTLSLLYTQSLSAL